MAKVLCWQDMPNGREKYQAYLASREWAILKTAVRERSGGTCERCKHDEATECHHQTYDRIYCERLEDLLDVCGPCHRFVSNKSKEDPLEYWRQVTRPPYQFVTPKFGELMVECPRCRGQSDQVHLNRRKLEVTARSKSDTLVVPFWCECGLMFNWELTSHKGYTYIVAENTGEMTF